MNNVSEGAEHAWHLVDAPSFRPVGDSERLTLRERWSSHLPLARRRDRESQGTVGKPIYARVISRLLPRRTRDLGEEPIRHSCVICRSSIADAAICAPCGHHFDTECLIALVEASTRDESQFPPRCCQQPIPTLDIQPCLPSSLSTLFAQKSREFSTRRRVYCANPTCSSFLGPRTKGQSIHIFACPSSCGTFTCSRCRAPVPEPAAHRCRRDRDETDLLVLASRKGWARCPACERVIELHSGCYHMTCMCGTQFCYLCRAPWKTCACASWEEVQLRDVGNLDFGQTFNRRTSTRAQAEEAVPLDKTYPVRRSGCDDLSGGYPEVLRSATQKRPSSGPVEVDPWQWDAAMVGEEVVIRGLLAQHHRRKRQKIIARCVPLSQIRRRE